VNAGVRAESPLAVHHLHEIECRFHADRRMSQLQHRAVTEQLDEPPTVARRGSVGNRWSEVAATTADSSPRSRVIERDLDLFGQTVNLASRIADAAGPGEVLASEAVAEAAGHAAFGFERIEDAQLKGLPGLVPLFRVTRIASA
jgi:class 3 adenylate cyclase